MAKKSAPQKTCPSCEEKVHCRVKVCPECDHEFFSVSAGGDDAPAKKKPAKKKPVAKKKAGFELTPEVFPMPDDSTLRFLHQEAAQLTATIQRATAKRAAIEAAIAAYTE